MREQLPPRSPVLAPSHTSMYVFARRDACAAQRRFPASPTEIGRDKMTRGEGERRSSRPATIDDVWRVVWAAAESRTGSLVRAQTGYIHTCIHSTYVTSQGGSHPRSRNPREQRGTRLSDGKNCGEAGGRSR